MRFFYIFLSCLLTTTHIFAAADDQRPTQSQPFFSSWWGSSESSSSSNREPSEQTVPISSKPLDENEFFEIHTTDSSNEKNGEIHTWQRYFIESHEHNALMPFQIRQQLIDKGYKIIQKIVAHESIEHQINIFENAGRTFVEASWLQQMPTQKSIKKIFNKSLYWTSSFFYRAEEDQEEIRAQQKTLERRAFLESIIAVSWALADHAARLHHYKKDLLITIADPETVLWTMVNQYIDLARTTSDGSDNNFAYPTDISHEALVSLNSQQIAEAYTIDARFESNAWALPLFPYNNNAVIIARLHPHQQNISPAKTIMRLTTRSEGLTSLVTHVYNTYVSSMQSYQKIRAMNGAIYASGIKEYIKQEDIKEDQNIFKAYYSPEKQQQLMYLMHQIKENQRIDYGPLAFLAQYMIRTNQYSDEAKQAAHDFLNFLKKDCGDTIEFDENNVTLDSLIMYRIGDETIADLGKIPITADNMQEKPIILEGNEINKQSILSDEQDDDPLKELKNEELTEEDVLNEKEKKREEAVETASIIPEESNIPNIIDDKIVKQLFDAIEKKDVDQVTVMLEEHHQLVNIVNQQDESSDLYGRTPLHHAAFAHNLELVELLLKNGASLHAQDRLGRTPLFIAYQFTHKPIIKKLVEKRSNINTAAHNKESVLQTALRRNDFISYNYFLQHGGNLRQNRENSLSILYSIIGAARQPLPKNPLDRNKTIHEQQLKILQHQATKNFISEEHRFFPLPYKEFLKKLYNQNSNSKTI